MLILVNRILYFLLIFALQVFVFNKIEFGYGINLFIAPLYLLFLPFKINHFLLISLAFLLGFSIDFFSNTHGLHTSALLFVAYIRPFIYNLFAPRDGYDPLTSPGFRDMGITWVFSVQGILVALFLLWFFIFEVFRLSDFWLVFPRVIFSFLASMIILTGYQLFLFKPKKQP